MKRFYSTPTAWRIALGALVCAVVAALIVPHRIQTLSTKAVLQNGMKMEAQITLQSPWGWAAPDRVTEMRVSIDGRNVPVAKAAYNGLRPLDSMRKPLIAETKGFPEIIVWGASKATLTSFHWHFLNYNFSELDVIKGKESAASYFSEPPRPLQETRLALNETPIHTIVIGKDSVKTAALKEQNK